MSASYACANVLPVVRNIGHTVSSEVVGAVEVTLPRMPNVGGRRGLIPYALSLSYSVVVCGHTADVTRTCIVVAECQLSMLTFFALSLPV